MESVECFHPLILEALGPLTVPARWPVIDELCKKEQTGNMGIRAMESAYLQLLRHAF